MHGILKVGDLNVRNATSDIAGYLHGMQAGCRTLIKRKLLEYFVLGVPVYRLRFRVKVSRIAIQRFYHLTRAVLAQEEECREPFDGAIECDETTFGGHRKGKRGWGAAGKIIVLGILQRNGKVKVFPVQGRKGEEAIKLVRKHTKPGSLYYTDDWHAYGSLAIRGDHIVVRKEAGRPKGRSHINGIEGFWSYAKNWLYPYRGVPRKNFHLFWEKFLSDSIIVMRTYFL